jgi:hypothetical protein
MVALCSRILDPQEKAFSSRFPVLLQPPMKGNEKKFHADRISRKQTKFVSKLEANKTESKKSKYLDLRYFNKQFFIAFVLKRNSYAIGGFERFLAAVL